MLSAAQHQKQLDDAGRRQDAEEAKQLEIATEHAWGRRSIDASEPLASDIHERLSLDDVAEAIMRDTPEARQRVEKVLATSIWRHAGALAPAELDAESDDAEARAAEAAAG